MSNDDSVRTLYGLLGISTESSFEEVRRAFRFASQANHPDHNTNDPFAEERFKAIDASWELVNTAEKWEAYRAGAQAPPARAEGAGRHSSTPPRQHPPQRITSKVVVYGYTQWFAINPKVHVFWNGAPVGSVKKGDFISFDIGEDGEVSFKCSMRSAAVRVQAGRVTNIKISWDRATGKMIPQVVDAVTPGA